MMAVELFIGDHAFLHWPRCDVTLGAVVKREVHHALLGKGWDFMIPLTNTTAAERTIYELEMEPTLVNGVVVLSLLS